ncbi:O-acetyl-ADP-ribose deacetylase [Acinetobacter nematophilus]|uniref:O-acetyl-ADP-ribose deacetylase n=1 Tax=Acinetobacter nematophilus TaxID=2994642 RepID=UPI003AF8AE3F
MKIIRLVQGDITLQKVDAIVNAANTSLLGGGGVDGAIHRKGGDAILNECQKIRAKQGGCAVGEAVITTAGKLPSRFVIHTVGPTWQDGQHGEAQLLEKAYTNSLKLAEQYQLNTLAIPNISTGIYRFPKNHAASLAIKTTADFLLQASHLQEVNFVCFDLENFKIYRQLLAEIEQNQFQILGI